MATTDKLTIIQGKGYITESGEIKTTQKITLEGLYDMEPADIEKLTIMDLAHIHKLIWIEGIKGKIKPSVLKEHNNGLGKQINLLLALLVAYKECGMKPDPESLGIIFPEAVKVLDSKTKKLRSKK